VSKLDYEELKELTEIHIDPNAPLDERFEKYLDEIGNPYRFTVNGTVVNIGFSSTEKTLSESLYNYYTHKNNENNEII